MKEERRNERSMESTEQQSMEDVAPIYDYKRIIFFNKTSGDDGKRIGEGEGEW